ncbi:hypothetical protein SH528x_003167 [Novipirellula sp. SH528]|uniref:hypothetical protein n=1 Tax=Novipirellula sp. SH528 TaxID=3454466 RepID=UPI003F9EC925
MKNKHDVPGDGGRYSTEIHLQAKPMVHRYLQFAMLPLLVSAVGCSPPAPNPGPPSPTAASSAPIPDASVPDAVGSTATVDPSVDAGMMADEFEQKQRLPLNKVERSDAVIETNPTSKD